MAASPSRSPRRRRRRERLHPHAAGCRSAAAHAGRRRRPPRAARGRVIRALFLTHNYPRTDRDPVGSFVLRLAVALRAHDIESHIVAPAFEDWPLEDAIEGIP